jgi:hypothetical protein
MMISYRNRAVQAPVFQAEDETARRRSDPVQGFCKVVATLVLPEYCELFAVHLQPAKAGIVIAGAGLPASGHCDGANALAIFAGRWQP